MTIIKFPVDRTRKVHYTFDYVISHRNGRPDRGQISVDAPNVVAAEVIIRAKIGLWGTATLTLVPVKS